MSTMEDTRPTIAKAVQALGGGPLTEESVRDAIWPLFSRILDRPSHPKLNGRPEVYLANHSLGARSIRRRATSSVRWTCGTAIWTARGSAMTVGWPRSRRTAG
ncbi:MAG: hypothetical protein ACFHWZ_12700 [Phycisphaerales bacterium]